MKNNDPSYPRVASVVLVTLLQACGGGPESSSTSGPDEGPVPTNRMYLYLTVESGDPQTAVVRANLNDGDLFGSSYRLDGGDYFRACVIGECRNMADNDSIFTPDYIARLAFQPGVDYVVSFNRREAQSAPGSRVALPPAFTIVTPANRQQVTDGDDVLVTWTPAGAPAEVELSYEAECDFVSGSQAFSGGFLAEDSSGDGSESVRIDSIVSFARTGSPSAVTGCRIDITVSHELEGRIDAAFDDGIARGIVSRKVRLDYVPR
jgi:hypothetical protein